MKPSVNVILASMLALVFGGSVSADEVKPEDAIKYRKSIMSVMRWQLKSLSAMEKGERPLDKDMLVKNAAYLEMLSKMSLEGFVPGSDTGDTKAKPEIWADMDKFRGGMDKLQTETTKLAQVAKIGDMDQIRAQFGETEKTCKACHNNFRSR
jgi:cytochrome c556